MICQISEKTIEERKSLAKLQLGLNLTIQLTFYKFQSNMLVDILLSTSARSSSDISMNLKKFIWYYAFQIRCDFFLYTHVFGNLCMYVSWYLCICVYKFKLYENPTNQLWKWSIFGTYVCMFLCIKVFVNSV